MRFPGTVALLAAFALASCGQPAEPLVVVERAWVNLPAVKGRPGAAYFTLKSNNDPTKLVGVSSPSVQRVELHEGGGSGGMMHMAPMADAVFPDGGVLTARPGGMHAMLFGI